MRPAPVAAGVLVVGSLLACSTRGCGRAVHHLVPAVEEVNPEYATEPVDCGTPYPTPAMVGCTMGTLTCGQTVEGHTGAGDRSHFGDDEYQHWFCTPQRNDYEDSPEAVYALEVPADTMARIRLTSDCADLDVAAVAWTDARRCPTARHGIRECEMDTSDGGGEITVATVGKPQTYLLVVDGKHGEKGNFRLEVDCRVYR